MLGDLRIAVIIPAYQASATIGAVIRDIPEFVDEIIVVDDGSLDDTRQAALEAGDPRLTCLRRDRNGGVGAAMVTGFTHALGTEADICVKMDADGQMDPERLKELLRPITEQGFDYTKGNRFYDLLALSRMPLPRRLGNVALSFMTKAASGYWNVYDPQNGYIAIRSETLARLDLNELDRGYFLENSMLVQLNVLNARVAEVPIAAVYGNGRSAMSLPRVMHVFPFKLLRAWLWRIRLKYFGMDFSPIAILLVLGALLLLGGSAYGSYEWIRHVIARAPTPAGAVMLAALPVLVGVQLLLTALILEIQQTPSGLGIHKIATRSSSEGRQAPEADTKSER